MVLNRLMVYLVERRNGIFINQKNEFSLFMLDLESDS